MNLELLEHELSKLNGKPIIIVRPGYGRVSDAISGVLTVTSTEEHTVGFHLMTFMGVLAIIFYADDVLRIEPGTADVAAIVRLKGPHDYKDHWQHA